MPIPPDIAGRDRLQPSLLDRLTDDAPELKKESFDKQVLSMQALRHAVLRDIAWLLNSTNLGATEDLEPNPRIAASTLNYGIPALSGLIAGSKRASRLEAAVADALRAFEPRLRPESIKVTTSKRVANKATKLLFEIEGELWAQPAPIQLFLETAIDIETRVTVITEKKARS